MSPKEKLQFGIYHNSATRIVIFEKFKPIILSSIPILGGTFRIRAIWTPELAQDLEAYPSINYYDFK